MRTTSLNTLVLALSIATPAVFAADLPGKGVVVKPLQSTIAEETFQTELVNRALEKLGYDVQQTGEVDYNVVYRDRQRRFHLHGRELGNAANRHVQRRRWRPEVLPSGHLHQRRGAGLSDRQENPA